MNAAQFVKKWAASTRSERAASQEHFIDLCGLLNEQTPNTDPSGDYYAFEKGARTADREGWADVWQRGHFAWEYKGKHKDLVAAYAQLQQYREALDNPPLLVVCDMDRYEVHTNWTSNETWIYRFDSADIPTDKRVEVTTLAGDIARDAPEVTAFEVLKALFAEPERLKPGKTTEQITQEAAAMFGRLSAELRKWDVDDMRIARFITRLVFCMFATDVGLLPKGTFTAIFDVHSETGDAAAFRANLSELFERMNTGGTFMMRRIPRFNGRLFEDSDVPEAITSQEILALALVNELNWADVEPAIFGTLFERVLDPQQRKMLGAHYTSRADIELIVEPVLMEPLRHEWDQLKVRGANAALESEERQARKAAKNAEAPGAARAKSPRYGDARQHATETQRERVRAMIEPFAKRLATIRVLDPACGSGNFLYVSLALLKALEKEVIAFASIYDVALKPRVHPRQLLGIETNEYAHEIASAVIWIGYLQWKHRNAVPFEDETPILQPLDHVEGKDAIVDLADANNPKEATWPKADVVVGNPPFLGGKRLRTELGDAYIEQLFAVYDGRVARESDLCCYWFEKARAAIEAGHTKRAGLLATQAIRGGANRRVLERIKESGDIFYAQADRKWIQEGVAVRVSMVGFDDGSEIRRLLNEDKDDDPKHALMRARAVEGINANLTHQSDVTKARRLKENLGVCFQGPVVVGDFDMDSSTARSMLDAPNPHGESNACVIFPLVNAADLTGRTRGYWIIDFGQREIKDAALFEQPFERVRRKVKPKRDNNRDRQRRTYWWRHGRAGTELRAALTGKSRQLVTPRVSKHRLWVWERPQTVVSDAVVAVARDDDYFFGLLHSRAHEVWSLRMGTHLEDRPRYTPTTCFEAFPFPEPSKQQQTAIADAAQRLDWLRSSWLNPHEDAISPSELKKRTLTNLYNERPTWLADAHRALDEAVFAAYGWPEAPDALADAEIIGRLLRLNLGRESV